MVRTSDFSFGNSLWPTTQFQLPKRKTFCSAGALPELEMLGQQIGADLVSSLAALRDRKRRPLPIMAKTAPGFFVTSMHESVEEAPAKPVLPQITVQEPKSAWAGAVT